MTHRLPLVESLRVLHAVRTNEVVITNMGTAREWMTLGSHPLDFVLVPSSMGQAPSLGLGIALARPDRKVIVCNGDGAMLMNLGALVTITAQAPANFVLLLFDNGVYEVTGAQATPATDPQRRTESRFDFRELARASGFQSMYSFDTLKEWQTAVHDVLNAPGPTLAVLNVAPIPGAVGPRSPGPANPRALSFAAALNAAR
jgi:thiamine pyrophosphate-dependent acetolactate synthase large subunit-like protein